MGLPFTEASSGTIELRPHSPELAHLTPIVSSGVGKLVPSALNELMNAMKTVNPRIIRKLHRWIGLIFSLSILMSAGSGVIHNVISRTQPPPPAARPGGDQLNLSALRFSPAEAAKKLGGAAATVAVNLRTIQGEPWYQFFLENDSTPGYVSASTGLVDEARDEAYARQIAMNFLGGAEVTKTDYLTSFNKEYINIFRILPVYRFDLADDKGTRVYVSTVTGTVTRHTDNRRQFEANLFSNLHKFMFIKNKDVRDFVLTGLTTGIFVAACLGIVLFFVTRPRGSVED
jgi:uncharacterized iron-regulated membrane protein